VLSLRAGQVDGDEPAPERASTPLDELLLHEGAEIVSGLTGPFTEAKRSHRRVDEPPEDAEG